MEKRDELAPKGQDENRAAQVATEGELDVLDAEAAGAVQEPDDGGIEAAASGRSAKVIEIEADEMSQKERREMYDDLLRMRAQNGFGGDPNEGTAVVASPLPPRRSSSPVISWAAVAATAAVIVAAGLIGLAVSLFTSVDEQIVDRVVDAAMFSRPSHVAAQLLPEAVPAPQPVQLAQVSRAEDKAPASVIATARQDKATLIKVAPPVQQRAVVAKVAKVEKKPAVDTTSQLLAVLNRAPERSVAKQAAEKPAERSKPVRVRVAKAKPSTTLPEGWVDPFLPAKKDPATGLYVPAWVKAEPPAARDALIEPTLDQSTAIGTAVTLNPFTGGFNVAGEPVKYALAVRKGERPRFLDEEVPAPARPKQADKRRPGRKVKTSAKPAPAPTLAVAQATPLPPAVKFPDKPIDPVRLAQREAVQLHGELMHQKAVVEMRLGSMLPRKWPPVKVVVDSRPWDFGVLHQFGRPEMMRVFKEEYRPELEELVAVYNAAALHAKRVECPARGGPCDGIPEPPREVRLNFRVVGPTEEIGR